MQFRIVYKYCYSELTDILKIIAVSAYQNINKNNNNS